jgi:hypothetical protein
MVRHTAAYEKDLRSSVLNECALKSTSSLAGVSMAILSEGLIASWREISCWRFEISKRRLRAEGKVLQEFS